MKGLRVFKRADSPYFYADYTDPLTGVRTKLSTKATHRVRALRIAWQLLAERRLPTPEDNSTPFSLPKGDVLGFLYQSKESQPIPKKERRIEDDFDECLRMLKGRIKDSTIETYEFIVHFFERYLDKYYPRLSHLTELTPEVFKNYKNWRFFKSGRKNGITKRTINTELRTLNALFNRMVEDEDFKDNFSLEKNPIETSYFKEERISKNFLSREEINLLLDNTEGELHIALYFLAKTGRRVGELEALEWTDINFDKKVFHLRPKKDWSPKGNRPEMNLPMNDKLTNLLKDLKAKQNDLVKVFTYPRGYPITRTIIRNHLKTLTKRLGLGDITTHDLRHSFISIAINEEKIPISVVQRMIGHLKLSTTEGYLHASPRAERDASNRMGNI